MKTCIRSNARRGSPSSPPPRPRTRFDSYLCSRSISPTLECPFTRSPALTNLTHGMPLTTTTTTPVTILSLLQVTMPTEDQAAAAKEAPVKNVIAVVKALYDFTATKPDEEIDLLEGDVVQVEYKAENGWWVGNNTRTKRNGIFPGTYVEEM